MTSINFGKQSGFVLGANNQQKQSQAKQNIANNQTLNFTTNPNNTSFSSGIAANNSHFGNLAQQETKETKKNNFDKYFKSTSTSSKGNSFNIIGLFSPGEFLNNAMEKNKGQKEKHFSIEA